MRLAIVENSIREASSVSVDMGGRTVLVILPATNLVITESHVTDGRNDASLDPIGTSRFCGSVGVAGLRFSATAKQCGPSHSHKRQQRLLVMIMPGRKRFFSGFFLTLRNGIPTISV